MLKNAGDFGRGGGDRETRVNKTARKNPFSSALLVVRLENSLD